MDANQTSETLLNLVKKSNLNFNIIESPFSVTITIKKSFIKNKDGTLRSSGLDNFTPSIPKSTNSPTMFEPASITNAIMKPNLNISSSKNMPMGDQLSQAMNLSYPKHMLPSLICLNNPQSKTTNFANFNLPIFHQASPVNHLSPSKNISISDNLSVEQQNSTFSSCTTPRTDQCLLKSPQDSYKDLELPFTFSSSKQTSIDPLSIASPMHISTSIVSSPTYPGLPSTPRAPPPIIPLRSRPTSPPGFPIPMSPSIFQEELFDYKNFSIEELKYLMTLPSSGSSTLPID